ncbi:SRPBCC family protein [Chitinophaga deserti]|uniref:SRPBCC family protein n=1 Tax=Chitinophaga deserti TaxID=2164099 RepID=UPI000D6BFA37|nr:SRPBCC family protein [Chitinophaga deserti]
MRLIKFFLLSMGILVVLGFVLSLAFPSTALLERSGAIEAPAGKVFDRLSDLKTWKEWNPWHPEYNPKQGVTVTYGPITSGAGAMYTWETPGTKGLGRVKITEVVPGKSITYIMTHPDMKHITAHFDLKPTADGNGTAILWRFEAHVGMTPWWKLRGFMMDRMFGATMEEGLNHLKRIAEMP